MKLKKADPKIRMRKVQALRFCVAVFIGIAVIGSSTSFEPSLRTKQRQIANQSLRWASEHPPLEGTLVYPSEQRASNVKSVPGTATQRGSDLRDGANSSQGRFCEMRKASVRLCHEYNSRAELPGNPNCEDVGIGFKDCINARVSNVSQCFQADAGFGACNAKLEIPQSDCINARAGFSDCWEISLRHGIINKNRCLDAGIRFRSCIEHAERTGNFAGSGSDCLLSDSVSPEVLCP